MWWKQVTPKNVKLQHNHFFMMLNKSSSLPHLLEFCSLEACLYMLQHSMCYIYDCMHTRFVKCAFVIFFFTFDLYSNYFSSDWLLQCLYIYNTCLVFTSMLALWAVVLEYTNYYLRVSYMMFWNIFISTYEMFFAKGDLFYRWSTFSWRWHCTLTTYYCFFFKLA